MMSRFFQPPDCHFMQEDGSFSIVLDIETDMVVSAGHCEHLYLCLGPPREEDERGDAFGRGCLIATTATMQV